MMLLIFDERVIGFAAIYLFRAPHDAAMMAFCRCRDAAMLPFDFAMLMPPCC